MNHDNLPTNVTEKPKFESAVEFKDKESQQKVMAELVASSAEWTVNNIDMIHQRSAEGNSHIAGMKLKDFKDFVAKLAPGMSEEETTTYASRIENDVFRFNNDTPMPDDPARLDRTSNSAIVGQGEVMKYGVHMMKETGLPFEGASAQEVEDSIKAHYAALGYDINDPGVQMNIKEILETE
jgi:hypothetical protein